MPRKADWNDTLIESAVANGGQLLLSLMVNFAVLQTSGLTIVRLIGSLTYYKAAPSNDGNQVVDVGMGLASQESFAAGVVPDPKTDADEPVNGWMYRDRVALSFDATEVMPPVRTMFDLRSSRKIDGAEPYIVFDNSPAGGTAQTVEISGIVRMLYLRP